MKIILLATRYLISNVLLFCIKMINSFKEITSNNFILVTSSTARPLFKENWGDYISTILIKQISPETKIIKLSESWNIKKKENYLCIGSIISWMTTDSSIIWGSGVVYPETKVSAKPIKVCAVRGPLTRKYLLENGVDCPEIYGDPALLLPRYYTPRFNEKKYEFGIIPHFRDKNNSILKQIQEKEKFLFIDVQDVNNWHSFIDKIYSCKYILSSSLHGIIVADSYNIPNIWIEFENGEKKRFAFHDYFQSALKDVKNPLIINENSDFSRIAELIQKSWEPHKVDLDKLLSASPFHNKRNKF